MAGTTAIEHVIVLMLEHPGGGRCRQSRSAFSFWPTAPRLVARGGLACRTTLWG